MSFVSDLFKGKTSNLGNDLAPSNIFSDTAKDIGGKNTIPELAALAALGLGGAGLAGLGGLGAAGAAAGDAAVAGAPLDILAGGAAAGTAVPSAVGDIGAIGDYAGLTANLATDPGFAGSVAGDTGSLFGGTPLAGLTPPGANFGDVLPSNATPNFGYAPANTTLSLNDPTDFTTLGPGGGSATGGGGGIDSGALNSYLGSDTALANSFPDAYSGGGGGGNSITNWLGQNKGLLGLLGLGLGGQILSPALTRAFGLDKVPGSQNLTNLANQSAQLAGQQAQYGQTLEQPLVTGQLPPGAQAAVDKATADAITNIKARYGSLGLTGSTMEADAISNAQQQAKIQQFQIAQQMAQTGQTAVQQATANLGLEDSIYNSIMQATIAQDEQLGSSIARFAAAVGGGTALKNATGGASATG